jgi:hypothetical protein
MVSTALGTIQVLFRKAVGHKGEVQACLACMGCKPKGTVCGHMTLPHWQQQQGRTLTHLLPYQGLLAAQVHP